MLDRSDRRGVTHTYIIVINRVRQPRRFARQCTSVVNKLTFVQRALRRIVKRGEKSRRGKRDGQRNNRIEDIGKGQIVQYRV